MPTATFVDNNVDDITTLNDKAVECEAEPLPQDVAENSEGVVDIKIDVEGTLLHVHREHNHNENPGNVVEEKIGCGDADAPEVVKEGVDGNDNVIPELQKTEGVDGDDNVIPEIHKTEGVDGNDIIIPDIHKTEDNIVREIEHLSKTPVHPKVKEQQDLIQNTTPTTTFEIALVDELNRKESHIQRLSGEVMKLKAFISKRKQTYKRKRKDEGAPTRALSAYNIFVQDRFSRLAKENEAALKSADTDAQLKRVPPASLVASTGNQWKELSTEEKSYYEDRAKEDRKRYDEQMAKYQPPDKQANRKRNKTGYNMFFSAHVLRLKQSESGVPSERGSVARLVGNAWKELTAEDKQYYEREADKQNGMNSADEEEDHLKEEDKRRSEYPTGPPLVGMDPNIHRPMPPQMGHAPVVHQPSHHDPRVHYPPTGPPGHYQAYPGYYDYHQPPPPPPAGSQGQRSQSRPHHPSGYQYHPYPPYHEQGQI